MKGWLFSVRLGTRTGLLVAALVFLQSTACDESSTGADHEADPDLLASGYVGGGTGGTTSNSGGGQVGGTTGGGTVGGSSTAGGTSFAKGGATSGGSTGRGGTGGTSANAGGPAGGTGGSGATGGGGGNAGAAGGASSDIVEQSAARSCQKLLACAPLIVARLYGDVAACKTAETTRLTWLAALPGTGVTSNELSSCFDATTAGSCDAFFAFVQPMECWAHGSLKVGASCQHAVQCDSGRCEFSDAACGKCAAAAPLGGACTSGQDCEGGLVCSSGGHCRKPVNRGATCGTEAPCENYLYCSGTCQAPPSKSGDSCSSATLYCDDRQGLGCTDSSAGQCVPAVAADDGEACGSSASELKFCTALGSCSGTCTRARKLGESCDENNYQYCAQGTFCADGECVGYPSPTACQ
jgi:hypothetical protein